MAVIVLLPLLGAKRISGFIWVSWVGLLAAVLGGVALVAHLVRLRTEIGFSPTSRIVYFNWDFDIICEAMNAFSVAFFAEPFLAPACRYIANPTRDRVLGVAWAANIISAVISYFIPFAGYLFLTDVEDEDYIFNHLDQGPPEVLVGWLAFFVLSMSCTAYYAWFISQNIVEAIAGRRWATHRIPVFTTGIAIVFMSIGVSMMDDMWSQTLYTLGGFAFDLLAFILPAVYYLAQFRFASVKWGVVAVLVLVFGLFILGSSLHGFVLDMIGFSESAE
jgi:hypothetical protein